MELSGLGSDEDGFLEAQYEDRYLSDDLDSRYDDPPEQDYDEEDDDDDEA